MKQVLFCLLFLSLLSVIGQAQDSNTVSKSIVNPINAKSDSILHLNSVKEFHNLKLRVKDAVYGGWVMYRSPYFNGWRIQMEFENSTDSSLRIKIPQNLIATNNFITPIEANRDLLEGAYLKKFHEKITVTVQSPTNTVISGNGKVESGTFLRIYMINKTETILKSTMTPDGITSEFFDSEQKQISKLYPNYELEIFPNSIFQIDLFYNGKADIKPIGLIVK